MDDELKAKLFEYLETIEGRVDGASDFVASEAPLVVAEFIQWEVVVGLMIAGASVLSFLIIMLVALICWKKSGNDDAKAATATFGGLLSIVAICFCFHGLEKSTKAYVAPRIVVLEKIHEMAN